MSKKIFFCDVETTGTTPSENGIIQIAGIVQIDGEVIHEVNRKVKPFEDDVIMDEALEVTGYTRDKIASFEEPDFVYRTLTEYLEKHIDKYDSKDKFHFVGYNANFDSNFMRAWFRKNDDPYYGSYFFYPAIDLMQLVAIRYMKHRHKFENYKLLTVCEAMGMDVDEDKAHDAMYDIELTQKLFNALREMIDWNK